MKIHSNISAVRANNALSVNEKRLTLSIERLSSGYKINHAKDNPAGLAISRKMNLQIRGLTKSTQSAGDGISVIETAEGALAEVQEILQRMNELAVKGSNGPMTDKDRSAIQDEINQLQKEITRIAEDTDFNGGTLLDGTYDYKGYSENNPNVSVAYYSDNIMTGKYSIDAITLSWDTDGNLNPVAAADITFGTGQRDFPADCVFSVNQDVLTIKNTSGFEMKLEFSAGYTGFTAADPLSLDIGGIGGMKIQIGDSEGQELDLRIPTINLKLMDINQIDFSTQDTCKEAIDKITNAMSYTSAARSRLGAYQNRLEHATTSLDVTVENMTGAYSRIMDINMATEMTEYTKHQVLTQAGTTMLAQANERPSQILQLLQ